MKINSGNPDVGKPTLGIAPQPKPDAISLPLELDAVTRSFPDKLSLVEPMQLNKKYARWTTDLPYSWMKYFCDKYGFLWAPVTITTFWCTNDPMAQKDEWFPVSACKQIQEAIADDERHRSEGDQNGNDAKS